jgi:hydroxymethylbilane synthase
MSTLRLGTRGSPLALYQANAVADLLRARTGADCEIVVIRTSGDRLAEASLSEAGGKRLFVKEIEDALLEHSVDLAVHSCKDMPAVLPDGLVLGAVLPREEARDGIVLPAGPDVSGAVDVHQLLSRAGRIGTSSVRRVAQLGRIAPAARFLPVRGNIDTRLSKLDAGDYDALVLAAAGLRRLGRTGRISALVPVELCVPAPGQGIIAVEVRRDDTRVAPLVRTISDASAEAAARAERAVVERLGGGCQMPLGAFARVTRERVTVMAVVASIDGVRSVRAEASGSPESPEQVGAEAAEALRSQGADGILAEAARAVRLEES